MGSIALKKYVIHKFSGEEKTTKDDLIALEEPLQIVLIHSKNEQEKPLTITMRSPGNDFELTIGLLFSESIISHISDIEHIRYCNTVDEINRENKIKVTLKTNISVNTTNIHRSFLSNSSCGICGKVMLEQLNYDFNKNSFSEKISVKKLLALPEIIKKKQLLFKHTGSIHACALFSSSENEINLIAVKEDIGRHNALDKLIGSRLINKKSFENTIAVLSGRVGYEMAQKAAKAGIPIIVAIGAPTSLAIDIAEKAGICLIGFVKNNSLNVYTNVEYIDFNN